jgi:hypothetical protein
MGNSLRLAVADGNVAPARTLHPRVVEVPMNRAFMFLSLLCIFSIAGVIFAQRLPTQRVETLPRVELTVGTHRIQVPVARTSGQRSAGLRGSASPVLLFAWPEAVAAKFNIQGCDRLLWRFDLVDHERLGVPVLMKPGTRSYPVSRAVRCVLEIDPSSSLAAYFKPGSALKLPALCIG